MFKLEGHGIVFENGVCVGEALVDVDGYYKFWPVLKSGYWEEGTLRALADFLAKLNAPWHAQVTQELGGTDAAQAG